MPHFFSNKRLILLMVGIIILVILVGLTMREREQATIPEQIMRDSVGVVQSVFQRPAYFVRDIYDDFVNILNVHEENERLKGQLNDYAMLRSEVDGLREENNSLTSLYEGMESLSSFDTIPALVIDRQPDRWTETIGINRGTQHGVETDMAVITEEGLIGRVQYTSAFTSQVQLLSDGERTNRVSAKVSSEEGDPAVGFIEGWDVDQDLLVLQKVDSENELEPGQFVSTSGLGGLFPADLPIGEIVDVQVDEYGLTQNAYIEPSADFFHLNHVLVIERNVDNIEGIQEEFLQQEEEEDESEGSDD
ncbi:rod shape-determining protein MreC [Geomicrobium sediminis]|uniref:Cell shape-determining protein MreC n=1 Tax=Geomicrobium sediminis TaxID=1347788 RepID=A0ABS2P8N1_9BACL|nr:rod shape-determining protein MreC [Geomicrobium sediminis]MBM7631667.1 rod shape-determining protein MreC [Geomicrobium sediminis]